MTAVAWPATGSRSSLWSLYPPLVLFVIVATANHYWFDAAAGAWSSRRVAAVAAAQLARLRPAAWAWPSDAARQPGV